VNKLKDHEITILVILCNQQMHRLGLQNHRTEEYDDINKISKKLYGLVKMKHKTHLVTCQNCLHKCKVNDFAWLTIPCPGCQKNISNPAKTHRESVGMTDYRPSGLSESEIEYLDVSQPDQEILNELKIIKEEINQLQAAVIELMRKISN